MAKMTQLEAAQQGKITPLMQRIAKKEGVDPDYLCRKISQGRIVIPYNRHRKIRIEHPCAIGEGVSTKINTNLGTSPDAIDIGQEEEKLKIALRYGTDTVMDLSCAGDLRRIRKRIIKLSSVPVGTVPIYEAAANHQEPVNIDSISASELIDIIRLQAEDGVDFFTLHAGLTLETVNRLKTSARLIDIVSRGGALLVRWMIYNKRENPLYEYFDEILDIAYRYDITLSLGDGMRPGSVCDATDRAQIQELLLLGELAQKAQQRGVQVMIEGPGHIPMNEIEANVIIQKKMCNYAPFYVLGPLVTDVALGYDHISAAIGGAIAAYAGADFLCYVTPAEHLCIPSLEDVKEGVIATRIAAHSADLAKGDRHSWDWVGKISSARKEMNWKRQIALSIDPHKARLYRRASSPQDNSVCTMCGAFCSIKNSRGLLCQD